MIIESVIIEVALLEAKNLYQIKERKKMQNVFRSLYQSVYFYKKGVHILSNLLLRKDVNKI